MHSINVCTVRLTRGKPGDSMALVSLSCLLSTLVVATKLMMLGYCAWTVLAARLPWYAQDAVATSNVPLLHVALCVCTLAAWCNMALLESGARMYRKAA